MNTKRVELHGTIREGYQILLRADAELMLPCDAERIAAYYSAVGEKCMLWITEVYGGSLQRAFTAIEDVRQRARFKTVRYTLCVHPVYEDARHAAYLCESRLEGERVEKHLCYRRMAQVWNVAEETLLPWREIVERFASPRERKKLRVHTDGVYPCGDSVVFFRNATADSDFFEGRVSMGNCEIKNDGKST